MKRPSLFFVWSPQWFYSWPIKVVRGEDEHGWRTLGVVTWAGSIFVRTNYCGCCASTPENVECQTCDGSGVLGASSAGGWQRCPDCTPENVECPTCGGCGYDRALAPCPDCTPENVEEP